MAKITKLPENPEEFNEYIQQHEAITRIYTLVVIILFIIIMILLFKIAL